MSYEKIVYDILKYINKDGNDLFKKSHMGKPRITYFSVFYALCEHGDRAATVLDINNLQHLTAKDNLSKGNSFNVCLDFLKHPVHYRSYR